MNPLYEQVEANQGLINEVQNELKVQEKMRAKAKPTVTKDEFDIQIKKMNRNMNNELQDI